MIKLFDEFDNMFKQMDAMFSYPMLSNQNRISNNGLKRIIGRPYNIISKKDDKGKIVNQIVEVPYTPFSKSDISVEIKDNVITVKCGKENKITEEGENMEYCGISYQSYQFSLPILDSVDVSKIEAKAEDGMLRINMPMKPMETKKDDVIKIEVK